MAERVEILIQAIDRASQQLTAINGKLDEMNQSARQTATGTTQLQRSWEKLTSASSILASGLARVRSFVAGLAFGAIIGAAIALTDALVGQAKAWVQAGLHITDVKKRLDELGESIETSTLRQLRLLAIELQDLIARQQEFARSTQSVEDRLGNAILNLFGYGYEAGQTEEKIRSLTSGLVALGQQLMAARDNAAIGKNGVTALATVFDFTTEQARLGYERMTQAHAEWLARTQAQPDLGGFITEKTTEFMNMGGVALDIWSQKLTETSDVATAYQSTLAQINLQHVEGENRVNATTLAVQQMQAAYQALMPFVDMVSQAMGAAFAQAIVYGENLKTAIGGALKAIAAMIIQLIVSTLIKKLLTSVIEAALQAKLLAGELARYAAVTYAAAFASSVGVMGPAAAGYAAGMTQLMLGGATVAGAQGAKVGAGIGKAFVGGMAAPTPMATGGIVTQPTLALIGEAGPEAVIPLDRAGAGGQTFNLSVNFSGPLAGDRQQARQFAIWIDEALFELKKRGHSLALA